MRNQNLGIGFQVVSAMQCFGCLDSGTGSCRPHLHLVFEIRRLNGCARGTQIPILFQVSNRGLSRPSEVKAPTSLDGVSSLAIESPPTQRRCTMLSAWSRLARCGKIPSGLPALGIQLPRQPELMRYQPPAAQVVALLYLGGFGVYSLNEPSLHRQRCFPRSAGNILPSAP
ncbi:hypothetical protein N658DRAFT_238551 [Parathielavia hyrcaniae]|uniref:Uncharacterized protein n=1 Tax=Parathielavia hyrcaniae TaxID=113614 RepID=A0AAN6T4Q3_9PEZI|nr:hypothetical protein N658DRAFT_238551 [Parathielavia hyrcaniae]